MEKWGDLVSGGTDHEESEFHAQLGRRIRELRQERGISMNELASMAQVTVSFLSQLETGKKACSLMTLQRITTALGIPAGDLFGPGPAASEHPGVVVRSTDRPQIRLPGIRQRLYVLSANRDLNLEPLLNLLPPGVATSDHPTAHGGEEWLFVLQGTVRLEVHESTYILTAGDAAAFSSSLPHRMTNIGAEEAQIIWVNAPRQF
jgi:transcriptional regulator with XRE-family HTH domain